MATKAKTGKTPAKKTAAAKKAAPKKKVAVAKKKNSPSIEFKIFAPGASEIFLAGDFNGWEGDSTKFRLRKYKGDIWKKKVPLKPGRYEYQFVVDGNWWSDPDNPERTATPFGSENSVLEIS